MKKVKAFIMNVWESIKGHPFSIGAFFLGMCCIALKTGSDEAWAYAMFFLMMTTSLLMLEALYEYWEKMLEGKLLTVTKRRIVYALIVVLSAIYSAYTSYKTFNLPEDEEFEWRFFVCYLFMTILMAFYLFYKLSKLQFELYCAQFFEAVMKIFFIICVMIVGVAFIVYAFEELIFDAGTYDLSYRLQLILAGAVYFPCFISEISKSKESASKFSKILINYVLMTLLSIAFLIVYIYIIKIVVTVKFPSNEVFGILTFLFCSGICIWTMAQGVGNDKMKKILTYYPFAFVPFIVLQIICLYMRVAEYGFTVERYFGLALILFEIVYFAIYAYSVFAKKNIIWALVFEAMFFTFFTLAAPFTNFAASVIASQKHKIEKFLAESTVENAEEAYDAYSVIYWDCGKLGKEYIEKNLSEEQLATVKEAYHKNGGEESFWEVASCNEYDMDIEGYKMMYPIDFSFEENGFGDDIAFEEISECSLALTDTYTETINLKDYIRDLNEIEDGEERDKYLEEHPLETASGAKIYLTYIRWEGKYGDNYSEDNKDDISFEDIGLSGYLLEQ